MPDVPLHMARDGLGPSADACEVRERGEVPRVALAPGLGEAWLVSRYADVREILADPKVFSNLLGTSPVMRALVGDGSTDEMARMRKGQLLAYDPPEHTRLRRMLTPAFTMHRMRALAPRIEEIVSAQLDQLELLGPGADIVSEFAVPIPSLVICELLGVPAADSAEFQRRTARQLDLSTPEPERLELARIGRQYMAELVARSQAEPGRDLLGTLVRTHGSELDSDTLTNIADLLLTAGHETTSSALAMSVLALLTHLDQLAALRDDATLTERAVEELLRYVSVAHSGLPRVTTRDVRIASTTIPKGDLVIAALTPANHDPEFVTHPENLDLRRAAGGHVAFGHGVHHCLGAPLARTELQIALPALLRRFPRLQLATSPDALEFEPNRLTYTIKRLPVTW